MFYLILIYFFLIIAFSLIKNKPIESPTLNLFKFMFPSWKFFDESVDTPVLLYKLVNQEKWKICFPYPKRKWFHFLYNPEVNFYLAYHSHIQQLLGELNNFDDLKLDEFHKTTSYKITENFVRFLKPTSEFQFKISSIKKFDNDQFEILEDILISPLLQSETL